MTVKTPTINTSSAVGNKLMVGNQVKGITYASNGSASPCGRKHFLGDRYGGWMICEPANTQDFRDAIVYTVGVGNNIEWDKAMMDYYGTVHHGWDPTPVAVEFIRRKPPPRNFHFHKFGLSSKDGNVKATLPVGNIASYTTSAYEHAKPQKGKEAQVPVLCLQSMLKMLNHRQISILKIDIEGAEFDVIRDWALNKYQVPADQILVEFHERYFKSRKSLVTRAINQMKTISFQVFHRTKHEISFIRSAKSRNSGVPTFKYRYELGEILETERAQSGVELGVQRGVFAEQLLKRWPSCRKYVLVDLWARQNSYKDIANVKDEEHLKYKQKALSRVSHFKTRTNIEVCHNYTTSCADLYQRRGELFDFIYVDARHDYKGVLEDLQRWWPLLKPGGILAGHDYVDQMDGPSQSNQDWTINFDGTKDESGRVVKGAVDDFANRHGLQLTISYRESSWNTWATRKSFNS